MRGKNESGLERLWPWDWCFSTVAVGCARKQRASADKRLRPSSLTRSLQLTHVRPNRWAFLALRSALRLPTIGCSLPHGFLSGFRWDISTIDEVRKPRSVLDLMRKGAAGTSATKRCSAVTSATKTQ